MANGDDSKNQQKTNEEIKKGNTLLSDQALIVQNLRNAFDSLVDKIRDSIEEAIDSMDDLSSSTEKLAKSNLRDVESGIKKIGRTLENNSEIQYRINQGQDQSKKIADQRAKIEARHSVTVAQIQASTLLTAKQKENLKELADKEFNKAKDLNDELKKQNINQLKGVSLYKMMGKNLEGIVNKIDESGVLAAGLRGELDATTFALRASEAGAMSFVNMMVNGIVTISKNMTALQKDFGFTADEALKLIEKPTEEERTILSNFKYKENIAYIHFDENIMPKNKKNWCSWNSSVDELNVNNNSVTYWLNLLQNLKEDKNIFLTLNPYQKINEEKIFKKVKFTHPYYDQNTLINQKNLSKIQNKESILFCGSYFGYGFHEDGIKSSLNMLKYLND